jgi:hypothetical protein
LSAAKVVGGTVLNGEKAARCRRNYPPPAMCGARMTVDGCRAMAHDKLEKFDKFDEYPQERCPMTNVTCILRRLPQILWTHQRNGAAGAGFDHQSRP